MTSRARIPIVVWLLTLAACLVVIARTQFTADMSAFLPRSPTPQQQLLVDQLKEGMLSRTLLIGIEGADAPGRARLSRALAARMRASGLFVSVSNGEAGTLDRELLFSQRYLLSPAVTPEHFSTTGLRDAIGNSIDLLASPAGMLVKGMLPHDPSGEMMALLSAFEGRSSPPMAAGVWASADGRRAILMAQTRAAGSDTDGLEAALERIRAEFAGAGQAEGVTGARLLLSGSPVFSVNSRSQIRDEVTRLTTISTVAIVCLLLLVYRSLVALGLGLLPVATGAVAGIAAVSLAYGSVHGITIGFGTTLIGEAVDYTIYYFVQSQNDEGEGHGWLDRFWPTIRLGVATSVCGFSSLLFSGFPGLAQLGMYSIAGLLAAAATTRYVVPHLRPAGFRVRAIGRIGLGLAARLDGLRKLRWPALALTLAAAALVSSQRHHLWNPGLSGLNPVPAAAQELDHSLRADLGAPDLRYLVVVTTPDQQSTLAAAEAISPHLEKLVDRGIIAGFETPTRFLPSAKLQRARQQAIPPRAELAERLNAALTDLPLQPARLTPFLDDAEKARQAPLLTRESLDDSSLGVAVDAMLLHSPSGWTALLPLKAPTDGPNPLVIDADAVRAELDAAAQPGALFVDLLGEFSQLYDAYLGEAILLSLAGLAAIVLLLAATLRSSTRLLQVLLPLLAAVFLVIAGLTVLGERLTLLHLIGLLLIVAVGSNYALFFDQGVRDGKGIDPQTLASLALANLATVIGFGALAFSQVPMLRAIGITVGPGAVLALVLSAVLVGPGRRPA